MKLQFRTVAEPRPGPRWKSLFDRSWPAYRAWFLRDGDLSRPDLDSARRALRFHMPELEPLWEELVVVSEGDEEAVAHLRRIPCNMAYNVLVIDKTAEHAVVSLAPDRAPLISETPVATNHQQISEWSAYRDHSRSEQREAFLDQLLNDPATGPDGLAEAFLEPPLFSLEYSRGFGTLYTARYDPVAGRATFMWPGRSWVRSFEEFDETECLIDYEESPATVARRVS